MLRYKRYLLVQLLLPTFVITLTLTGIVWLTQALRFIDLIVNKGLSVSTFLYLSVLLIPALLMIIMPAALFAAVLYAYNKLIAESELIVLKSAGLSRIALTKPALAAAALITLIGLTISSYLLPLSYQKFKETQLFIRDNYATLLLQEGVFSNPAKGLTVYIESRDRDGALYGILVYDGRDKENPATMMAEYGKLIQTEYGPRFELRKGSRQQLSENGALSVLYFDEYPLDLSFYSAKHKERFRTVEERYIHELLAPKDTISEKDRRKFFAEGHHRIIWPLYSLVLTLIAIIVLFSGQFNRRGQPYRILFATFTGMFVIVSAIGLKTATQTYPIFVIAMYINICLPAALCWYLLGSNRIVIGQHISQCLNHLIPKTFR